MTDDYTLRRAEVGDAGAIGHVHVASWRTTYAGIVAQDYIDRLSVDERAQVWTKVLSGETRPGSQVFVATDGSDEVVGFVSGGPIREPWPPFDAELYAIYLLARVQGQGLGRALIRLWAADFAKHGFHSVVVRALAENPACGFYERLGARLIRASGLRIGDREYPEVWYGWDSIDVLTT